MPCFAFPHVACWLRCSRWSTCTWLLSGNLVHWSQGRVAWYTLRGLYLLHNISEVCWLGLYWVERTNAWTPTKLCCFPFPWLIQHQYSNESSSCTEQLQGTGKICLKPNPCVMTVLQCIVFSAHRWISDFFGRLCGLFPRNSNGGKHKMTGLFIFDCFTDKISTCFGAAWLFRADSTTWVPRLSIFGDFWTWKFGFLCRQPRCKEFPSQIFPPHCI